MALVAPVSGHCLYCYVLHLCIEMLLPELHLNSGLSLGIVKEPPRDLLSSYFTTCIYLC